MNYSKTEKVAQDEVLQRAKNMLDFTSDPMGKTIFLTNEISQIMDEEMLIG